MIILLCGKSAAGKDTYQKKIIRLDPYYYVLPIISYTTRPMRVGEKNGEEYHFVNKKRFHELNQEGLFIEVRHYEVLRNGEKDVWSYGSPKVDLSMAEYVGIVDLDGVKSYIKEYGSENIEVFYIYADDDVREERAKKRGSFDKAEWDRRLEDDDEKFSEENLKEIEDLLGKKITYINNN